MINRVACMMRPDCSFGSNFSDDTASLADQMLSLRPLVRPLTIDRLAVEAVVRKRSKTREQVIEAFHRVADASAKLTD